MVRIACTRVCSHSLAPPPLYPTHAHSLDDRISGNLNALAQLMHLYAAESSLTAAEIDGYLDEIYRYCVVYTYAVIMQLLTLDHLPREARHLVSPEEIAMLESTKKPRKFVHFRLQELVLKFRLKTEHYIAIQNLLTAAEVNAATCRRIKVRSSASLVPRLPLALRSLTRSLARSSKHSFSRYRSG